MAFSFGSISQDHVGLFDAFVHFGSYCLYNNDLRGFDLQSNVQISQLGLEVRLDFVDFFIYLYSSLCYLQMDSH